MRYIFLDDIRMPPDDSWIIVRSVDEAKLAIEDAIIDDVRIVLSLDHDLGDNVPTGYDLLNWLERLVVDGIDIHIDEFRIHSANPVGCANMERAICAIRSMQ